MDAGLCLGIAFSIHFVLLRSVDERFISIFSIAKQNLRRRRLRFVLTLTSVIVLAMSFVTFTSFSTGYGLTSSSHKMGNLDSEGILVRRSMPSNLPATMTFLPLETSTITWLEDKLEVSIVAPKFENMPRLDSIGALSSSSGPPKQLLLFGVLGIQPSLEAKMTHIDGQVIRGRYLDDDERGRVLISHNAAERLGVDVGDGLLLSSGVSTMKVFLVGILDDHRFSLVRDIDAQPLIPRKLVLIQGDSPTILLESCDPSEVLVLNWRTSLEFFQIVSLSRVDIGLRDPDSMLSFARRIALERDLLVWSSFGGVVHRIGLGEYLEAKGLPIMIPWIIVVLNVVITMLNSLFERRKEIAILSSLGLNPSHIGGIFMAEAAAIGIVGGGAGYLLGLSGYRATLALSLAVEVRQKVSAFWCLASVGVAVAAALVGTGVALRSSVVITPSLLRRWTMERKAEDAGGEREFQMPVRLHENDVGPLLSYLKMRIMDQVLSSHFIDPDYVAKHTTENDMESSEGHVKSIYFNYFFGQADYLGAFPFSLIAEKKKGEESYTLKLVCKGGNDEMIQKKATFIRMLIVDWNAQRK
jgi:ABC-type lipoprotein release transport system permease subunit